MTDRVVPRSPLRERQAGVLLHPTSLPGPWGSGDLGADAYRFVDLLAAARQRVWQILPVGPTHDDGSPYQSLSVHAGSRDLISVEALASYGWLDPNEIHSGAGRSKGPFLSSAYRGFLGHADEASRKELEDFVSANSHWLEDFALFCVLKDRNGGRAWTDWPAPLRDRDPAALEEVAAHHEEELAQVRFEQFVFFRQWRALKDYANGKGVAIFGDMPIFVAHDSADVWAQRQCFALDEAGQPTVVAGVPPDYFSETGQRWGNPHYDWEWMEADGFSWWQARMESQLALFDLVRIDHFRGFESYWEVPSYEETAINGRWVKAPGDALFATLQQRFDPLPVVAEDLGIITEEVNALRERYALPGMKILQFAFDGGPGNPYLPHNHVANSVVYTGTHDNDTTLGWYDKLAEPGRTYVDEYLGHPRESMPWPLVRSAYASVARLAVIPFQDLLALDGAHRMNTPGTTEGNWGWCFSWEWLPEDLAGRLSRLADIYGR